MHLCARVSRPFEVCNAHAVWRIRSGFPSGGAEPLAQLGPQGLGLCGFGEFLAADLLQQLQGTLAIP